MRSEMNCIGRCKATVAQRAALRPLFEACAREKGLQRGKGSRRESRRSRETTEKQPGENSAGISRESKRGRLGSRNSGTETRDARVGE